MRAGGRPLPVMYTSLIAIAVLILVVSLSPLRAAERDLPKPTAKDKCPVCGMFVTKYPDWTSLVLFKGGSHAFFDGAKDMFKYLLDLKRYNPAKKAEEIDLISVMDYYSISWINARNAWYVLGSDAFGPMGRELIPLGKESDAVEFMKDHKGKKIIRFRDVTPEVIKTLD